MVDWNDWPECCRRGWWPCRRRYVLTKASFACLCAGPCAIILLFDCFGTLLNRTMNFKTKYFTLFSVYAIPKWHSLWPTIQFWSVFIAQNAFWDNNTTISHFWLKTYDSKFSNRSLILNLHLNTSLNLFTRTFRSHSSQHKHYSFTVYLLLCYFYCWCFRN